MHIMAPSTLSVKSWAYTSQSLAYFNQLAACVLVRQYVERTESLLNKVKIRSYFYDCTLNVDLA